MKVKTEDFQTEKEQAKDTHDLSERQTDCREVDGHGKDDEGHDPEHGFHGSQVGVVNTRLCTQLKQKYTRSSIPTLNANIHHFSNISQRLSSKIYLSIYILLCYCSKLDLNVVLQLGLPPPG